MGSTTPLIPNHTQPFRVLSIHSGVRMHTACTCIQIHMHKHAYTHLYVLSSTEQTSRLNPLYITDIVLACCYYDPFEAYHHQGKHLQRHTMSESPLSVCSALRISSHVEWWCLQKEHGQTAYTRVSVGKASWSLLACDQVMWGCVNYAESPYSRASAVGLSKAAIHNLFHFAAHLHSSNVFWHILIMDVPFSEHTTLRMFWERHVTLLYP